MQTKVDETETLRREETARLNAIAAQRAELEKTHGQVWDTTQLQQDYSVKAFLAPFVSVTRKSDGVEGLMKFQHSPRFYFDFGPV